MYCYIDMLHWFSNENVDIKLSEHDMFLEYPSSGWNTLHQVGIPFIRLEYPLSGTHKIERLESQIILSFRSNETKGSKQDNKIRLNSPMSEGGEP